MKIITIHKAQNTTAVSPVESVCLHILEAIPETVSRESETLEVQLGRLRSLYEFEAGEIMSALKSLPRGTKDALLVLMLDEKRSLLVVQ